MEWIKLTPDTMPPLNEDVFVVRPAKKGGIDRTFTSIAYLFKLDCGVRAGQIDGEKAGDKSISLIDGGIFWAFPAIQRFEDVSHWMPLPKLPDM